jgi:LuxR family quorum sensing-dependent transcriptional regulator
MGERPNLLWKFAQLVYHFVGSKRTDTVGELSSVLDFVVAIEKLNTADEVWNLFVELAARLGLPFAAFVDLPGPGEQLQDTAFYLSCPKEWRTRYFERNYFRNDPAALHLGRTTDPYTWADALACPDYTAAQRRIVYEAGDFGMNSGFVVPLMGLGTRIGLIEVAGSNTFLSTREKAELRLSASSTHSRIRAIWKPNTDALPPLSDREREVLQWAAIGKSDWEIGEILSISEKTANAHIENVKRKYGVRSRVHAVVKGMNCRAIHL